MPLEENGCGPHFVVSSANLPRLAEALQPVDCAHAASERAVRASRDTTAPGRSLQSAVPTEVSKHAEEALQYDHVLHDLLLSDLVERLDDLVVLKEEKCLAHAVLVLIHAQLLQQQLRPFRHSAGTQRCGVVGAHLVVLPHSKVSRSGLLQMPVRSGSRLLSSKKLVKI